MRKTKQDLFFKTGDVIGNWTVVDGTPKLIKYDLNRFRRFIEVKCSCGTVKLINSSVLRSGSSKSCGCATYIKGKANPNWTGTANVSGTFYGKLKWGAKNRKIKFKLSIDDLEKLFIKQNGKCALSGLPIKVSENKDEETTASIDRIDSSKGYELENIQFVHKSINYMKQSLSDSDFIFLCEQVTKFRRN